jgi:FkbM family methyltransferase
VDWIDGLQVYAQKGWTGITGNLYTGLHEFEDMGFLLHFLTDQAVFFDVGANVGSYSLLAAGVRGAKCISFEPAPETFQRLVDNVTLNSLSAKIRCIQAAIGAETGTISFTKNEDTTNHIVKVQQEFTDTVSVPMTTLDHFAAEAPILIKIDVEGFETEVINGAHTLLMHQDLKAIIIELNGCGGRYGYNDEDIDQTLRDFGFAPFTYNPFERQLKALVHFGNFNTIYIRDLAWVAQRLRDAPAFSVFGENI